MNMDEFDGIRRRRYYVDPAAHVPVIAPIHPDHPRYELGALSLEFAKIQLRDVITTRIRNLKSALKALPRLTPADVDRQESPSPWPPPPNDAP